MTAEPTTAAGRALLGKWFEDYNDENLTADLAAIEAEAVAAERRRIAERVRALDGGPCVQFDYAEAVDRNAVLDIIERQP